jgi:hypothetical protein
VNGSAEKTVRRAAERSPFVSDESAIGKITHDRF